MKKPTYLLLGWKPAGFEHSRSKPKSSDRKYPAKMGPDKIPGTLPALASGDAKTVIAAACAAPCGVLLFEIPK